MKRIQKWLAYVLAVMLTMTSIQIPVLGEESENIEADVMVQESASEEIVGADTYDYHVYTE